VGVEKFFTMNFSIMITTRNRSMQLRETLAQIRMLDPAPSEVLITLDGCNDDTLGVVRAEMPDAVVITNSAALGSVASRAAMMERATGALVLALDDDSYPEQANCLALLEEWFASNDRLAIATFPQRSDEYPASLTQQDFGPSRSIRSFSNAGACLRVSVYRQQAGFEPIFFHMYEEPDYALQCVANGWEVMYFPEITIRHHWTPNQRSEIRNHHRHARNELWSTLMRCPFPQAFGIMMYRVLSQARFAASRGIGWLVREPLWWYAALRGLPQVRWRRRPVTWAVYRKWLSLPDG
jgi:GT2 family glycosyltransferase